MPYLIYLNGNLLCPAPDIVYWTIEHLWQRPTPYAAAEFIGRRVSSTALSSPAWRAQTSWCACKTQM
jgi:hypothetical protein